MEQFKLPILSCNNLKKTDETLISELELVHSKSNVEPIYKKLFNPQTEQGKTMINEISKYYTNSISFIEDTQELYKTYKPTLKKELITNFNDSMNKIKNNVNFLKDYQYLDIKQIDFLNNNELFLQLYSIYNISSPAISLIYPIFIFIIPFFLLKLKFKDLPFSAYKNLLFEQLKKSSFGKLRFIVNNEVDAFKKLYVLVTIGLYVYGIYQNIRSCIKFIKNIKHIKTIFTHTQKYFEYIKEEYDRLKKATLSLSTYEPFITSFERHVNNVKNIRDNILNVNINLKKSYVGWFISFNFT